MLPSILQCISTINFHILFQCQVMLFHRGPSLSNYFFFLHSLIVTLNSYILKEQLVFYFLSGESVECASSNFGFRSQFTADLDQFDQLLPTLEKAPQLPGLCETERMDGAVTNVAIKSEILPSALQSTTARPTSRLNSMCWGQNFILNV